MWMFLILALAGAARADEACDACVGGRCHNRRTLLQGFRVSDQLAIDRDNNILYTQLNGNTTIAFFLDQPRILTVQVTNTTGLAVDQETNVLYSSHNGIIYAHTLNNDRYYTQAMYIQDKPKTPAKLRYEDTLYTINKDGSCGYFSKNRYQFAGYDNLRTFVVTDMANVKAITNWFFVSNNKLYRYVISGTGEESWRLISNEKHVLSIGKNGDNYFGDESQKVIYKLDRWTMELQQYASYETGSVKDFVFDRDENIVFLDADGSVAQWVLGPGRCQLRKNEQTHPVVEMEYTDNVIITLLRKDVTSSDGPVSTEVDTEKVQANAGTEGTDETDQTVEEAVNSGTLQDWDYSPGSVQFFDVKTEISEVDTEKGPEANAGTEGTDETVETVEETVKSGSLQYWDYGPGSKQFFDVKTEISEEDTEKGPEANAGTEGTDETVETVGETVDSGSLQDYDYSPGSIQFFDVKTDISGSITPTVNAGIGAPEWYVEANDTNTELAEEWTDGIDF